MAVFACALLAYGKSGFDASWDLVEYLSVASNIARGNGFVGVDGSPYLSRPVFTVLLAAALSVGGDSLGTVAWTIYALSAGFATFVYLLSRRLYGEPIGILTAALFVFSPKLILWIPRHLDPLWPALLIGSLLCLMSARLSVRASGMLAGSLSGFAVLTKEFALLFCLVPVLLAFGHDTRVSRHRVVWYFFSLAATLAIWVSIPRTLLAPESTPVAAITSDEEVYRATLAALFAGAPPSRALLDTAIVSSEPQAMPRIAAVAHLALDAFRGLWIYFTARSQLFGNLPAAPLVIGAFVWVFAAGVTRRQEPDWVIAALFIAFAPMLAACGMFDLRFPQVLLVVAAVYIAFAKVAVTAVQRVAPRYAYVVVAVVAALATAYGLRQATRTDALLLPGAAPLTVSLAADPLAARLRSWSDTATLVASNDSELINGLFLRLGTTHQFRLLPARTADAAAWINANQPRYVVITNARPNGTDLRRLLSEQHGARKLDYTEPGTRQTEVFMLVPAPG